MRETAAEMAARLNLDPHVEGGSFRELYRDGMAENRPREAHGVIYYYLGAQEDSDFHVLDSDEYWLYHAGTTLEIWIVDEQGGLRVEKLGLDADAEPCVLLKGGTIFGARHLEGAQDGTLVSCVTVPEFTYANYRILPKAEMLEKYPESAAFWR